MIKKMPNIVLLGAPGCGKGTLAKHLVKEMGYVHFSTGDMFREIIQTPTELGKKIKAIMDSGSLISDDITNEMIKTYIEKALKENKHFILDGYPRTINQAKYLKSILDIDLAIYLTISLETAVKRISGRVTCPKCGSPMDWWTRVIGFLRPIKNFDFARFIEAGKRVYSSGTKEIN